MAAGLTLASGLEHLGATEISELVPQASCIPGREGVLALWVCSCCIQLGDSSSGLAGESGTVFVQKRCDDRIGAAGEGGVIGDEELGQFHRLATQHQRRSKASEYDPGSTSPGVVDRFDGQVGRAVAQPGAFSHRENTAGVGVATQFSLQ